MDARVLEKYIDKIYSFAISKTFTPDEADDLTQEILYQAVASLPKLTDKVRFCCMFKSRTGLLYYSLACFFISSIAFLNLSSSRTKSNFLFSSACK